MTRLTVDGQLTPLHVYEATGFWTRARGLLGRTRLADHEALWIRPCNSVHTIGMGYPIDLLFMDREQRVLRVLHRVEPLRLATSRGAHSTMELAAGTAKALALRPGSFVEKVNP